MAVRLRVEQQSITGFVLVILMLFLILMFLHTSLRTMHSVLENRKRASEILSAWYLLILQLSSYRIADGAQPAAAEIVDTAAALRERLRGVGDLQVVKTLRRTYPELQGLVAALNGPWPVIDRQIAEIETLLLGPQAGRQGQLLPERIDELVLNRARLDRPIQGLSAWLEEYSRQQLRAFQTLFWFLGIVIVFIALLLIRLGMEYARRRLSEWQVRAQLRAVMRAQEDERRRLALDLHDNLAQNLSTAKMMAQSALEEPTGRSPGTVDNALRVTIEILERSIEETRTIAGALRPPHFEHGGLVSAIQSYLHEIEQLDGLKIELATAGLEELELTVDAEIHLYRIVQEAVSNIRKHSGAHRGTIRLASSFPDLLLRVEDSGRGFSVPAALRRAASEGRLGVEGMRERAAMLNGEFSIRSRPGHGTSILVRVPIDGTKDRRKRDEQVGLDRG